MVGQSLAMFDSFMTDEERKEKALERARQTQTIINSYHRVFRSPDGEIVLQDLKKAFGVNFPAYIPSSTVPGVIQYDDIYGKIRDGQRSVILHIENRLDEDVRGDADLTLPVKKVKTGLRVPVETGGML
jgi:hypothetical protein